MEPRYDRLFNQRRYQIAEEVRDLALQAEKKTGEPIVYDTLYGIARTIGEDHQLVAQSMRLAYTAEFLDNFDWGFISPGSGRDGSIYGYTLLDHRSTTGSAAGHDLLKYTAKWSLDHERAQSARWHRLAAAHGRNTAIGKAAHNIATIMDGVAASIDTAITLMP